MDILKSQVWSFLWTIFILILCTARMPDVSGSPGFFFPGFDKMVHMGFFFILTTFIFFGRIQRQKNYSFRALTIVKVILITFILGGSIELIQKFFFPYRSAEWWDLGADMIGALMCVCNYVLLHKSNYNESKN